MILCPDGPLTSGGRHSGILTTYALYTQLLGRDSNPHTVLQGLAVPFRNTRIQFPQESRPLILVSREKCQTRTDTYSGRPTLKPFGVRPACGAFSPTEAVKF